MATLWIAGSLNWLSVSCLKSAVRQGHEVHLYSYGDVPNIPAGVTHVSAQDVIPEDEIFRYEGVDQPRLVGSYAPFSDAFRYRLLSLGLGVWIDSDMYFLRTIDMRPSVLLAWEGPEQADSDANPFARLVGNGLMLMPEDSPVVADLVRLTSRPYAMPPWVPPKLRARALEKLAGRPYFPGAVTYATVGPVALTHFVKEHGRLGDIRPHLYYYPVGFNEMKSFARPDAAFRAALPAETEAIHMWNSNFSKAFARALPKGSFAERVREESLDA